jgi:hypothetical protein
MSGAGVVLVEGFVLKDLVSEIKKHLGSEYQIWTVDRQQETHWVSTRFSARRPRARLIGKKHVESFEMRRQVRGGPDNCLFQLMRFRTSVR